MKYLENSSINTVVLVAAWDKYYDSPDFESSLETTLARLENAGKSTYIFAQVPVQPRSLPEAITLSKWWGNAADSLTVSHFDYRKANQYIGTLIEKHADKFTLLESEACFFHTLEGPVGSKMTWETSVSETESTFQ